MTSALCYSRCQPSPLPVRECVCGCRGRLHGIRAAQLVFGILRPAPLMPAPSQLSLLDKGKPSAAAEAGDAPPEKQEGEP